MQYFVLPQLGGVCPSAVSRKFKSKFPTNTEKFCYSEVPNRLTLVLNWCLVMKLKTNPNRQLWIHVGSTAKELSPSMQVLVQLNSTNTALTCRPVQTRMLLHGVNMYVQIHISVRINSHLTWNTPSSLYDGKFSTTSCISFTALFLLNFTQFRNVPPKFFIRMFPVSWRISRRFSIMVMGTSVSDRKTCCNCSKVILE